MKKKEIVIGIEGLVGAGKTSICRELLKKTPNSVLLNGGNLYRAIVYTLLQTEPNMLKLKRKMKNADIKKVMEELGVKIKIENQETEIYIGNIHASEEVLQSKTSSLAVSLIGGTADNTQLFKYAKEIIDELKKDKVVIVSGRSIMKIYPDIDYHFFITASLKERIKRKCIQYKEKNNNIKIKLNIIVRDLLQKMAGFYKIYPNTIKVDLTNCKSVKESTDIVYNMLNNDDEQQKLK